MKQCPKCSRTYSDDTFIYCLDDGSVLMGGDPQVTLRMPPSQPTGPKTIKTLVGSPTSIYTAFPGDPRPFPGSPNPSPEAQPHKHPWLLYASLAFLLLLLGGGGIALVLFELKVSPATARGTNQDAETQADPKPAVSSAANSTPAPTPAPSPSPYTDKELVGAWRTRVNEQGLRTEITVTFLQDGSTRYVFKDAQGRTETDHASWRYSDGILYERYSNGKSGKDSIRWIDRDDFELTIIDNGLPSYAGLKRRYHRVG